MRRDELPQFIDGSDAVQIAFALGVPPREQAVAAKNDAIAARIVRSQLASASAQVRNPASAKAARPDDGRIVD